MSWPKKKQIKSQILETIHTYFKLIYACASSLHTLKRTSTPSIQIDKLHALNCQLVEWKVVSDESCLTNSKLNDFAFVFGILLILLLCVLFIVLLALLTPDRIYIDFVLVAYLLAFSPARIDLSLFRSAFSGQALIFSFAYLICYSFWIFFLLQINHPFSRNVIQAKTSISSRYHLLLALITAFVVSFP